MVSDLTIFAHNWSHNSAGKKVFFTDFFDLFTLFKRLFSSTSYGPLPSFDFWNPYEKRIGKKGFQIWKLLFIKGVKFPRKKRLFFGKFFLTSWIFLVLVLLSSLVKKFFVSWMRDFFWRGYKKKLWQGQKFFLLSVFKKIWEVKNGAFNTKNMIKNFNFNIDCILAM